MEKDIIILFFMPILAETYFLIVIQKSGKQSTIGALAIATAYDIHMCHIYDIHMCHIYEIQGSPIEISQLSSNHLSR